MSTSTSTLSNLLRADCRPFQPIGDTGASIYCKSPEYMLVGGAGTGKTRANLEKLHMVAEKYPGCRLLIVRKERSSCTESVLVTFEDKVLPAGSKICQGARRENRHSYRYPNGSEIVIGGMDKPTKILSTEWDIIYCPEAVEFEEDDWETLTGRLRNWVLPYQQIIGDTNPGHPAHWLKARIDSGRTLGIKSYHEDNPALYDRSLSEWTTMGAQYMESLKRMTGHRRKRFLLGEWAAGEGARWDNLDAAEHQFDYQKTFPRGIPEEWHHIIGMDYGKVAPYCALWVAVDFEGNKWVYREDYQAGLSPTDQIRRVTQRTSTTEKIQYINADPACWSQPATLSVNQQRLPSVADFYLAGLEGDKRFGPLKRGFNKSRVHALSTIDDGLDRGNKRPNIYVSRDCPNLWSELVGAIWDKHGKEDIDERSPDHAITALYYAIHGYEAKPVETKPETFNMEEIRNNAVIAAVKESEKHFDRRFRSMRL